jgi:hypothetical protein
VSMNVKPFTDIMAMMMAMMMAMGMNLALF